MSALADLQARQPRWPVWQPVRRITLIVLGCALLAWIVLELLAYTAGGLFAGLAARLWLSGGLLAQLGIIWLAIRQLRHDLTTRTYGPVVFTVIMALLVFAPVLSVSRGVIGQDATQQLAAGVASFSQPDWHYTGRAFLGYPSRQYLLAALPSLIFGRSVFSLKLGFAWPFMTGLLLLSVSFRTWASQYRIKHGQTLALLAVSALLVFPLVTEYYIYFEHTLFPVCFGMQAIGWLLLYLRRPSLPYALALAWSGTMLVHSYTTSMAAAALLVFLLILAGTTALIRHRQQAGSRSVRLAGQMAARAWQNSRSPAWAVLMVAGAIIAIAAISFAFGRGDRLTLLREGSLHDLATAGWTGLRLALSGQSARFAGYLLPVLWLYLILAISMRLRFFHFAVAGWSLSVFALAQILQGYAVYPPIISFSRTLVTIPVLVTAWFLAASGLSVRMAPNNGLPADQAHNSGKSADKVSPSWLSRQLHAGRRLFREVSQRRPILARLPAVLPVLLIGLNLGIGWYQLDKPVLQSDAAKYTDPAMLQPMQYLVRDILQVTSELGLTADDRFQLVVITDNVWLKNPKDYSGYFFPTAVVIVQGSRDAWPEQLDPVLSTLIFSVKTDQDSDAISHLTGQRIIEHTLDDGQAMPVAWVYASSRSG